MLLKLKKLIVFILTLVLLNPCVTYTLASNNTVFPLTDTEIEGFKKNLFELVKIGEQAYDLKKTNSDLTEIIKNINIKIDTIDNERTKLIKILNTSSLDKRETQKLVTFIIVNDYCYLSYNSLLNFLNESIPSRFYEDLFKYHVNVNLAFETLDYILPL